MKLSNNRRKKTIITVAVVAVLVLVIVIAAILSLTKKPNEIEEPLTMQGISIASFPKTSYYIGEEFDPTGISVQVIMSKQSATYFVNESQLEFSGFDSSEPNESLVVTVKYKDFFVNFTVSVNERPSAAPKLTSIRLSDNFVSTYSMSWWNDYGPVFDGVDLILTYSDGSEQSIPMKSIYTIGANDDVATTGETTFTVKYSEGGIQIETTVTVTITN